MWVRVLMATALVGFVLSFVALAKARDKGGTGFQVLMAAVASLVLVVGILVYRRSRLAAARRATGTVPVGQHIVWLAMIRIAAFAAVALSAVGAVRSNEHQTMAGVMLVLGVWVSSVAIRLDGAARRNRNLEQTT